MNTGDKNNNNNNKKSNKSAIRIKSGIVVHSEMIVDGGSVAMFIYEKAICWIWDLSAAGCCSWISPLCTATNSIFENIDSNV